MPDVRFQLGAGDRGPTPYPGVVIADEPEAAKAARAILEAGGSAGDAAVTLAFSLAVTLPSAAGLGGGGSCIVHDRQTEPLDFKGVPGAAVSGARAAIPALPRGLLTLHAKYGDLPWAQVVAPAEALARFGHRVSPTFARALAADGSVLAKDGAALQAFMTPERQVLQEGGTAMHPDLATTLGRIRARSNEFYEGPMAQEVEASVGQSGVTQAGLKDYVPRWERTSPRNEGLLRRFTTAETPVRSTPASATTSFLVADGQGYAVACTLTMGQPFGLGTMVKDLGFLLAPAPTAPYVLPTEVGATRSRGVFVFAAAGGMVGNAFTPGSTAAEVIDRVPADAPGHMLVCTRAEDAPSPSCAVRKDPRSLGTAEMFEVKVPQ